MRWRLHAEHLLSEYKPLIFHCAGGTVRYFWEEKACDAEGRLLAGQDRTKCINKVGHALHDMDPVFRGLSYDPRVGCIARQLGMNAPLACQSMYIFKQVGELDTLADYARKVADDFVFSLHFWPAIAANWQRSKMPPRRDIFEDRASVSDRLLVGTR